MEWEWTLLEQNCPGCAICADVCPHGALAMTREMAYPEPAPSACVGCMICVAQCPLGAIEVREASPEPKS